MRNWNVVLSGVIAALCTPVVYGFQVGMFDLKPVVTLQEKFDDNVRSSGTNVQSDWITSLSLGLEGLRETRTDAFSFKGTVTQKVFAKENDLNTTSELLDLKYNRDLSRHDRINVENSFVHADESTSFKDEFGRTTSDRYDYYRNYCTLEYAHDFTEQLTTKIKYANEFFEPTIKSVSRSVLNRPGFEVGYAFTSRTIGSIFYDYSNRVFDPGGTVAIHSPAAGFRQYLTEQLYADFKAGANVIRSIDDHKSIMPSYSAALTNEINETTHAGIAFTRTHDVTYSSSGIFNNWNVVMFGGKQVTSRIYFTTALFFGSGRFASGAKEQFNGVNFGFDYEIRKNMKANVGYSYSRRDSSLVAQDYDKNTVFLGLTINF